MRENKSRAWMKGRTGESANRWKGEEAGYHAIHIWLTSHYVKGDHCEDCFSSVASRLEWANISGEYKRERSDYKVLCPKCHRLFDRNNKCQKGHDYTTENTITNIRGHRHCRICRDKRRALNATY